MNCLLVATVFLPVLGATIIALLPKKWHVHARIVAFISSCVTAATGVFIIARFDPSFTGLQQVIDVPWLEFLGIHFFLGLDGLNVPLVLMTLFLTPLIMLCSYSVQAGVYEQRGTVALILLMQTGALGTFLSQDIFLFYVFWEIILVPAYLLLGMYGKKERIKTAFTFFLYTFSASFLMFIGILYLLWQYRVNNGGYSAKMSDLMGLSLNFSPELYGLGSVQGLLFWAMAVGFLVKAPLVPLHGWLYQTYKNAPTLVSIYFAAILSKMGTYGVVKLLLPLFPEALKFYQPLLLWLAAIGLIYGGMLALAQNDLKSLIAYSSLSHVSGILLGVFALNEFGIAGAMFLMVSHAVIIFGLFFVVGILEKRVGGTDFAHLGGLAKFYPGLAIAFFCLTLAAIALPGTNGFVGEFFVLLGAFKSEPMVGIVAAFSVVLSAAYMLKGFSKSMFGPSLARPDLPLDGRERFVFLLIVALLFGLGLFPGNLLYSSDKKVAESVQRFYKKV